MLLELDAMQVRYGRNVALSGVSARIESKALGLLGPNGAGKSTLIRALLGLVPVYSGSAQLDGLNIRTEGRRIREQIGYMPEHESYLNAMTPIRFLRFMGEMCGLSPRDAMERAHEVLFYVGLGEVRYRPVSGLSYGMHQKLRLAQALIHGPRILILDEPTNGLDPTAREEMLSLISEMIAHSDSKIIISSHLLRDIEACCHDVLVLKKGSIVASGNIEEMKHTEENLFELRIKGAIDPFIAALADLKCECRIGKREDILVSTPDVFEARRFYEIADAQGVQIRHFHAKRDTLEDIFLKVLEDEVVEKLPGAGRQVIHAGL